MGTDLTEFWRAHDRTLMGQAGGRGVGLSHDLYRGMPPWFNEFFDWFQRRVVLRLLRRGRFERGERALDVGCGTGRWSGILRSLGLSTVGFDVGEIALRHAARSLPGGAFVRNALPGLPFRDGSFAAAVSVHVIQHLPRADQGAAVRAIHRVLRRGGFCVACELIDEADTSPHVFANPAETWARLFTAAGFTIEARGACEFLPLVKLFHRFGGGSARSEPGEGASFAASLAGNPALAAAVRFGSMLCWPLEAVAETVVPPEWARLGCFLLRKA